MVIDESNIVKPASVIDSRTGLLDVRVGDVIRIGRHPYKVLRSDIRTKTKDEIMLTIQFIYVRKVTANMVFSAIMDALMPART